MAFINMKGGSTRNGTAYTRFFIFMLIIARMLGAAGPVFAQHDTQGAGTEPTVTAPDAHAAAAASMVPQSTMPWWAWPLILFVVSFFLGIIAVLGGVGGGVLYVPIVGGFFPFNLDFVRGAGLMVALAERSLPARACSSATSPACGWPSGGPDRVGRCYCRSHDRSCSSPECDPDRPGRARSSASWPSC